jgi:hypothetical protein
MNPEIKIKTGTAKADKVFKEEFTKTRIFN